MLIRLAGGRVVDPANGRDGIGDVWIRDSRIIEAPVGETPDEVFDVSGKIVMAGAIDIHSHIAGGNVNTARLLLPENHRAHVARPAETPLSTAGWSTFETGCRYAAMGFTTVIEPAVPPHYALHAHLELADIPIIDKAILTVLGKDDFLLGAPARRRATARPSPIIVAWTLAQTKGLGIKGINAGGAVAFKPTTSAPFDLDDVVPFYGVTSRQIAKALQQAVMDLGIAASAASALQQSRRRRQCRYGAAHDRRPPTACRCISRICNSMPTAKRASAASPRRRRSSPRPSTRRRTSPSTSAR